MKFTEQYKQIMNEEHSLVMRDVKIEDTIKKIEEKIKKSSSDADKKNLQADLKYLDNIYQGYVNEKDSDKAKIKELIKKYK